MFPQPWCTAGEKIPPVTLKNEACSTALDVKLKYFVSAWTLGAIPLLMQATLCNLKAQGARQVQRSQEELLQGHNQELAWTISNQECCPERLQE